MRYGNIVKAFFVMVLMFALTLSLASGQPAGGTITFGNSSRGTDPAVQQANAQAGNVTQLNIDQTRITSIWQGFYGNVSGQIVLENSGGNNFYDWTLAAITGEVYASRNTVPSWTGVNCTNSTQWQDEETALNIPSTATDGINETYNSLTHPTFQVGSIIFDPDVCQSTRPYNSTGQPGNFYNVLLNSNLTNVVYAAIIADNADGFDGKTYDFEILVPTDKTTGQAVYYFYVELA